MPTKDDIDKEPEDKLVEGTEDESKDKLVGDREDDSSDDTEDEPKEKPQFAITLNADTPTDFDTIILREAVSNPLQEAMDKISISVPNDPLQDSIGGLYVNLADNAFPNSIGDLSFNVSDDILAGIAAQHQLSGIDPLTLPAADNIFLTMQSLQHDAGADLWESLTQNESFNASVANQLALKDTANINDSIRFLLENDETPSLQFANKNVEEMWKSIPSVELEDWKGLLSGSKSLDIDARVRATAAAERYIDFGNLTDLNFEHQISAVPDDLESADDDEEYVEEVADVEDFDDVSVEDGSLDLRAALVALVNQTEGISTTFLKVLVGDKESSFEQFGFQVGGLSAAASRVVFQSVIDEREKLENQDFQMYKVWIGVIAGIIAGLLAGLKLSS